MRILPAYVKRKLMWSLFWIRIDLNSRKWPEPVLRFLTFGNYFTRTSGNELMVRRQERTTLCFTDINVFVILPSPTRGQHIDVRFGKALHTSTWWLLSLHIQIVSPFVSFKFGNIIQPSICSHLHKSMQTRTCAYSFTIASFYIS